jgi:hypothetical protein
MSGCRRRSNLHPTQAQRGTTHLCDSNASALVVLAAGIPDD